MSRAYAQNMIVVVDAACAIWQNTLPPLPESRTPVKAKNLFPRQRTRR
jgi:hypothetical protein